jgi:diguanylate cyclase (GGDEF)-like protein
VLLFGGAAAWINLALLRDLDPLPAPVRAPWIVLVAGFALVEIFVIHLERGRQTHTFSLVEIPLVIGLYMASPVAVVTARLLGAGLALALHRRQSPSKLAFNLSMFALETSLAELAFRALAGDHATISPSSWGPTFIACVLVNLVGAVGVTLVISITSGRISPATFHKLLVETTMLGPLANTSVALCVTVLLWFEPAGALLMLVIAGVLVVAYRAYSSLRERYANLTRLYEFTRTVHGDAHAEGAVVTLLEAARRVMNAEHAELMVLAEDGRVVRATSDADGVGKVHEPLPLAEAGPLWSLVGDVPGGVLVPAGSGRPWHAETLRAFGWRDCVASSFRQDNVVAGVIAVANRVGDVATFDGEDLALFNALASHAVVTLDNSRLLSRLQHEALHDTLTGLPNRALFNRIVDAALEERKMGQKVAVLLLDLDRFKDVNDTLGHAQGDRLLQEVGVRLEERAPEGSTVARLSGDEFAVLLPITADVDRVHEQAVALAAILRVPFQIDEVELDAEASIGIALCPDHAEDPMTLLQRADVAMYAAKASGGVEVYSPTRDEHGRRRLTLVSELRAALERRELEVWYQPQAIAQTGAICAVEALVRWRHPTRGLLTPNEFIPVAEHTGLMVPLANYVIEEAARQWRAWHDAGLSLRLAVNLSMRNLQEPALAEEICARLAQQQMPPSALTVELTESSIMSDSVRATESLEALAVAGIGVAVDDFGTGYSSFTHLRELPVQEIKVDKSFVMHMVKDPGDAAIVRSVIDLGRNLGLSVVAEGVESAEACRLLAEWGCDRLQGYYLSKPAPPDVIAAWLLDRPAAGWQPPWMAATTLRDIPRPTDEIHHA